jgi:hypothetical protein
MVITHAKLFEGEDGGCTGVPQSSLTMLKSPVMVTVDGLTMRGAVPVLAAKTGIGEPLALTPRTCGGKVTLAGCIKIDGAVAKPETGTL